MSDAVLELAAWRFLAAHRVDGLRVTHVAFTDGDNGLCCLNTPCGKSGTYAHADGETFGEAAIELALGLGMPCTGSSEERLGSSEATSSAATATAGESEQNSHPTQSASADSTTGATGVGPRTASGQDLDQRGEDQR